MLDRDVVAYQQATHSLTHSINQSIFIVKTLLTERSGVTDKH